MKNIFVAFALLSLAWTARAQSTPPPPISAKKTVNPLTDPPNPWILDFLSFVDFHQTPTTSTQWEEIHVGYNFNDYFDIVLDWGYSGLLYPLNSTDAEIWDPEILFDVAVPLSKPKALTQWTLLTGGSVVLPASPDSLNNGLNFAMSGMLGLRWKRKTWTIEEINRAYVFFYQNSPTFQPFSESDSSEQPVPDAIANTSSSLIYYSTQQYLRVIHAFTPKVSAKLETDYYMNFNGPYQPTETLTVLSTVGYYFTPHFRVFGGVTSTSEIDQGKGQTLFNMSTSAIRVGFYLKL